jgi:hypothetical protein
MNRNSIFFASLAAVVLALGGCAADSGSVGTALIVAEEPAQLAAERRTFEVLDVWSEAEAVIYLVRTHGDVVREVVYADGDVTVRDASTGEWVATDGVLPERVEDALLTTLNFPAHAEVGFEALGIEGVVPSEVANVGAPEELGEVPYGCTRINKGCYSVGGCQHCTAYDVCDNHAYYLHWEVQSGCFLGFFCDCEGESDAWQLY